MSDDRDPQIELGRVLAALADGSRRLIVVDLSRDASDAEHACGSFDLPLAKATKTHHFKVLRDAGVISQRNHGNGSAVRLRRVEVEQALPGLLAAVVAAEDRARDDAAV
ncbi:transcriptional regulator, ArsR family [Sanguibacter gelidistatuariae]|uniref:Transcriptional regulator, ArsR family n=1 Tax=Sanguibacter gelidistatuariae TaxID=1814289 RepID=A0A1G6H6B9_9MICO|nr:helix-turn-helix domain-containing protein [Sanguibacter gelidistatuariae]SDB89724.1 transcriptional regulator, ArsR family [Sanguibacter gelidistatuariae]